MRQVRIFVSSPGDVDHERRRVERVAERLNGEFAGSARLTTVRWETEFYRAHDTFQAQIPEAAECEIVVAIFRSRIGTQLPADFARLPDGSPYPSGTAYEVLSAIAAAREHQLPDVYVFRYNDPPLVRLDDPEALRVQEQWERLKAFFDTWFVASEGPFKAAFHHFSSTDDFEIQMERLLRGWLEEKILHGRAVLWPIATKGSPFCGLAAFGAKHAPVFFGRSRAIERAVDQWKDAAESGCAFLLVVGASGSGKSSLARAGLIPRLVTPGVVPAVDVWRVAAMRPTETPEGPMATLAARLLEDAAAIPDTDAGRLPALPELAQSDYGGPAELAAQLGHADAAALAPLLHTLDRLGARETAREGHEQSARCDLVLLVDQLDELLGGGVAAAERSAFARLLRLCAESGRIWVVATLRADLYERFLAEPDLFALKNRGAAYDLAPPGAAELAEIVRKPAEAAGLVFERNGVGQGLDERLLAEADRPDMLPLLQLVLNRLFDGRATVGDEARLTHAAYETLGGMSGIIDREAEAALAGLDAAETAKLPRLLRQLATVTHADPSGGSAAALTTRTAPLALAAADPAARRLVEALVDARILLTAGEGAAAGVQLAHQRVLADWRRARELVEADRDFYRVRDEVEEARERWQAVDQAADRLIPRGLPLAEAEAMDARFGDEIPQETRAFIAASGHRARRRQRLTALAAGIFAMLAVGAGTAGIVAWREQQRAVAEQARAERNLEAAKNAVSGLVFDIAQSLRNTKGMQAETIAKVLQQARQTVDRLAGDAPDDLGLRRLRGAMLDEFAQTYLAVGDLANAGASAAEALKTMRSLVGAAPQNRQYQKDLGVGLDRVGQVALRTGDTAAALAAYSEDLTLARSLAAGNPTDPALQRGVAEVLDNLGETRLRMGDAKGSAESYEEALTIIRAVADRHPENSAWQRDLSVSLNRTGDISAAAGDIAGAQSAFDRALAIRRKLAAAAPNDNAAQHDLWLSLLKIGDLRWRVGDVAPASAAYTEGLPLIEGLSDSDPGNALWQLELSENLTSLGDIKLRAGDKPGGTELYRRALRITRRLATLAPNDLSNQRNLEGSLDKVGSAALASGDKDAALAAFNEALTISRQIVAREPTNMLWQNDLTLALTQFGDLNHANGDNAGAADAYNEAIGVSRAVAAADPNNVLLKRSVAVVLNKLGDVKMAAGDFTGARAAFQESLALCRDLLKRAGPEDATPRVDVAYALWRIGMADLRMSDAAAALEPVEEAVAIRQAIAKAAPGDLAAQREAFNDTQVLGDLRGLLQNSAGAAAAYRDAAAIARQVATTAGDPTEWQIDLVIILTKAAAASSSGDRNTALTEALALAETLERQGKLTGIQTTWPQRIRDEIAKGS